MKRFERWFVLLCVFSINSGCWFFHLKKKKKMMFDDWVISPTFVFTLEYSNEVYLQEKKRKRKKKSVLKVYPGDKFDLLLLLLPMTHVCERVKTKKITHFHWKHALHYLVQSGSQIFGNIVLVWKIFGKVLFLLFVFIETGKIISIFK